MKHYQSVFCLLLAFVFLSGCSIKQRISASGENAADSSDLYDPYAFESPDSLSYELPENAITVTPEIYRSSYTIINDLVHTKLEVRFDWEKTYLYGKAWITLSPHFYPTDTLRLDAKGFDIHKVELVSKSGNVPLSYQYDSATINIQLDKFYHAGDQYTIYIDYTSKPNDLKVQGSAAINDARGLYFINPDGKDPEKPRQVWTQGETESNSCWFPTIDKPNMKMTTEISMTAENGFVTLSNGLMVATKDNHDGTHTDTWKLDLPYAPYLVMMAAGPFAIVKDHWKSMTVDYYIDKAYAPYAREIFGNTPEMLEFFSARLGVPYAWPKYAQVVVHDYVSGAMENVSATLFYDRMNQTHRDMIDGKKEDIISHELFHQWFGDLVTCESWSNISLNESFATYGEYLWFEHKYGKEEADRRLNDDLEQYLYTARYSNEPLIRYQYKNREDVFDAISYQKGGRVLHLLRTYVGDDAFFRSLQKYLTDNRFGTGEADQLRLAFEAVTGQDLHWFFNQWYFAKGHPELNISYQYDETAQTETVTIQQDQYTGDGVPVFRIPLNIDVYESGKVTRYARTVTDASQQFTFPCASAPDLVNVDADKRLICEKTDDKTDAEFAFQMNHAPLFMDKYEALKYFATHTASIYFPQVIERGLKDNYYDIRLQAINSIVPGDLNDDNYGLKTIISDLAQHDSSSLVRAAAMNNLSQWGDPAVTSILEKGLRDSSYAVISSALKALAETDSLKAYQAAGILEGDSSDEVIDALEMVYARLAGPEKNDFFLAQMNKSKVSYSSTVNYGEYMSRWADNIEMVASALPLLYDIAANQSRWYIRLAGTNALESIYSGMEEKKQAYANTIAEEELDTEELDAINNNMTWLANQMDDIEKRVGAIKAAETNEHLKMIYHVN